MKGISARLALALMLFYFSMPQNLFSQNNIAINTSGSAANTGALLDLSNNNAATGTAGFMPPKVTLTNASLLSPVTGTATQLAGLIVYNTSGSTSNGLWGAGLYYWTGGAWVCISCCRPASVGTGSITYTSYGYMATYTAVGTTVFTPSCTGTVQVLVVAGGGGGGTNGGGGGGGGGVIYNASYAVTASTPITVTVGAGGVPSTDITPQAGTNGGNSVFGTLTAIGGGLAGDRDVLQAAYVGGSGGGGGGGVGGNGAAGTGGQGSAGGNGINSALNSGCSSAGGGGGGAGSAGVAASTSTGGNGGNGLTYFGNSYGGGGGGGTTCYNLDYWINTPNSCQGPNVSYSTPGTGGTGGGGSGEGYYPAASGGANTGGGGGGGGGVCGTGGAGSGGSGIVIVVYSY